MTAGFGTPAQARDPDQIRADIERTRVDLGDTIAALAGKADVRARARRAASLTRWRIQQRVRRNAGPVVAVAVAAAALAVLSVILRHQATVKR